MGGARITLRTARQCRVELDVSAGGLSPSQRFGVCDLGAYEDGAPSGHQLGYASPNLLGIVGIHGNPKTIAPDGCPDLTVISRQYGNPVFAAPREHTT